MNDKAEQELIEPEIVDEEKTNGKDDLDKKIASFEERTGTDTSTTLPVVHKDNPIGWLEKAIEKKYSLEEIQKMMELQEKWEKRKAEKAFFISFARFKQEDIKVISDKINRLFEGHRYPSVGNFLNTVNPFLGKHHLSSNFEIDDSEGKITVTAVIYHIDGHSLKSKLSASPDTKGPKGTDTKTEIHGAMSTVTHLMRATFSAVTGIAAIDPQFDDDANLASGAAFITKEQAEKIDELMEKTKINKKVFLKTLGAEKVELIPKEKFQNALSTLQTKASVMAKKPAAKKPAAKKAAPKQQPQREPGSDDE